MPRFVDAPEVEAVAQALIRAIPQHEPLARHLIRYVWREADTPAHRGGREVWGTARVLTGLARHLADDAEAVVTIEHDVWRALTGEQQRALVDHELCHLTETDGGALSTEAHDVEEFAAVIQRHGLWRPDLRMVGVVVRELSLLDEPETRRGNVTPLRRAGGEG
jgi:hypothetical protein